MVRKGICLLAMWLCALGCALAETPEKLAETVVITDGTGLDGKAPAAWVKAFADVYGGEIINAARENWKDTEMWYVREILEQHPRARAYVLVPGAGVLRTMPAIDPEAVARVGARFGYMIDMLKNANPSARILLVAPPQVDPERHAGFPESALVLSEMLNASLQKNALTREVAFCSLIDAFPQSKTVYPENSAEQRKMGQMIAQTLVNPLPEKTAPLCAEVARLAPPAAGMPVTDNAGADALVAGLTADLAGMENTRPAEKTVAPVVRGTVKNYLCQRDISTVMSEEGISLARGAVAAIREILSDELMEEEEVRMNAAFNFPGADEYAVISREPPVNDALISAIVPPKAAEGFAGAIVDWEKLPVPENPAFNAVSLAPAEKIGEKTATAEKSVPPAVTAKDFRNNSEEIPGMTEFEVNPAIAAVAKNQVSGKPLTEVVREEVVVRSSVKGPQQDLRNAPWNKPVKLEPAPELAETPDPAPRTASATRPAATVKLGENVYPLPDAEGGADEMPAVKIEALLSGEKTLAVAAETAEKASAYVNKESTMVPLAAKAEPLPMPGYAVYIHTAAE